MTNPYILADKRETMKNLQTMRRRCLEEQPGRINSLMNADYLDSDPEERTVRMEYTVREWEQNLAGILHGGVTCAMLDHLAGAAVYSLTGYWEPTVDMTVKFIRAARPGDVLCGEGKIISAGKRFLHIEAKLSDKESGRLVATAMITYANVNGGAK